MIDAEGAAFCADAYAEKPAGVVYDWRDCRAVLNTQADGTVVVAFRGTVPDDLEDWLRDIDALPERVPGLPAMGWCHAGFLAGGIGLLALFRDHLAGKRVVLVGHSLGGALAIIVAGLLTAADTPPALVVTFEAPRAGGMRLRQLLANVLIRQYRFGNDPITELPDMLWLYCHPAHPLTLIGHDEIEPFACHAMLGITAWFASLPAAVR
jgi:pimeloyl-ACP methyl ester carboxylesterase